MAKKNKNVKIYSKKKKSETNPWLYASIGLMVLLIASILTNGFGIRQETSVNGVLEQLETLKSTTTNEELKQALTSFEEELQQYKEVEVKEKKVLAEVDKPVKVDFYVMSQCPYGTQVEDAIYPVLKDLGDNVDFNVNFISTDLGNGEFQSLHGEPETQGNIVQLCAAKYEPEKYMDMIVCQNKNARAIPGNWESCAESNDMDVASIKACYEGAEGKQLLSESVDKSESVNARGSPTIYINDELYQGGRTQRDFLTAICNAYDDEVPQVCADIPKPKTVELTVVNDKECTTCDTTQIIGALKQLFPGLKPVIVDSQSSQGKALIEEFGLELAPAYIFDGVIAEEESFKSNVQLQQVFQKVGDNYKLIDQATGATWFLDTAKRDAYIESLKIPQTTKPEVELFVMSHCPYGTQSEKGILPAIRTLGDKVDFKVRFVYYAMHGQKEIDEQLNQYCIQKEQEDVYLDYLACFLKDEDASGCLASTGVDTAKMDVCVAATDSEFGITDSFNDKSTYLSGTYPLFGTDASKNTEYGVGGSPTLIINGKNSDAGRNPASYLSAICDAFTDESRPAECNTVLDTANPSAGFGYGTAAAATAAGCGV